MIRSGAKFPDTGKARLSWQEDRNGSPTTNKLRIIGAASRMGAMDRGCILGPDVIRQQDLVCALNSNGITSNWEGFVRAPDIPGQSLSVETVAAYCARIAALTFAQASRSRRFVVIGGDHSNAIGTWSGASSAIRQKGELGLIWVDAHMDAHTPSTSPSGAMHGMPLACLLGYGDPALCNLCYPGAKVNPQRTCLVGVRSFETAEAELLNRSGVRIFFMDEVKQIGFVRAIEQAIEIVCHNTAAFGISLDLDVVDPSDAPGVGTPVAGGPSGKDVVQGLSVALDQKKLIGLEVAEFNPMHDRCGLTSTLIRDVLIAVFGSHTKYHDGPDHPD